MLIIGRIYLFVNWLVVTIIIIAIVLMILRLVANYADLNPFAWPSLTLRRMTDPFLGPVRRALIGFHVDPKFAPLVTILLTILLGWFVLQLVASIANTIGGVLFSLQNQVIVPVIGYLLYGIIALYVLFIFMRIIFSWGMVSHANRVMRFLVNTTEPLLAPLRRTIPPLGMLDISPIVAFIILWLFQQAIAGTLLRNMPLQFFG
ncbi:MAG TPA: YggT family protein [Pyrinomonadaceae bacterium]|nr:YggT family protein [Pyrinomonadaceae bacterium]